MTRPPVIIDQLDPREPPRDPPGRFDGLVYVVAFAVGAAIDWRLADGVLHLIHHHRF